MKNIKKLLLIISLIISTAAFANVEAANVPHINNVNTIQNLAKIRFNNRSDHYMTIKIIYSYGGLYTTITLPPNEARNVTFGKSGSFKMKIKATHHGVTSYHDGGDFSVTCNNYEWTEGEMTFTMSSYGTGLGPSISAKEFESNY